MASNIPTRPALALALAGVRLRAGGDEVGAGDLRAALELAASLGCRAVVLNAAGAGVKPRELDRSARRDLAAALRRRGLACAGVDLWVPAAHWTDPAHQDRALSAATGAIELAADMARLGGGGGSPDGAGSDSWRAVVNLVLPKGDDARAGTPRAALTRSADLHGVIIADHADAPTLDDAVLRAGLDPASAMMGGRDPASEAVRLGRSLATARLSDLSSAGRVPVGQGRLHPVLYEASLAAAGYRAPVVLDVRQTASPAEAARIGAEKWGG